jgi:hypothetical protein
MALISIGLVSFQIAMCSRERPMFSATSHHISMDQQLNQKQTELFDASFKHRFDVEKPIEMSGHFEARPGGRVSDLSSAQISTGRVSDDE